jgi:hypothetical protein
MPVPLALLQMGLGLAGAGVQYFGQQRQLKGQQEDAAAALERERAASAQARAGLEGTNYDVAQSYRTMLDRSRQDPVADALRAQQQRREASNVGALKAGGAKALIGGLGSVTQQSADAMSNIEADSFSRQQAALQTYGAQEQAAQDANTQKQLGLYEFDYGRAIGRGDEAETKLADVTAARQNLGRDTLSGLLGMAGQTLGSGLFQHSDMLSMNAPTDMTPMQSINVGDAAAGGNTGGLAGFGSMSGPGAGELQYLINQYQTASGYGGGGNTGGLITGEKGMITPGEFSHDTNPIHMMKDGAKVGELTGGEVVLNPKQEKKVAAESPYFRALLKKFKEDAKKRKK